MTRLLLCALLFTACATEGGPDGGAAALPNRGVQGWQREPDRWVLTVAPTRLTAPTVLRDGDAGLLMVAELGPPTSAALVTSRAPLDGLSWSAPTPFNPPRPGSSPNLSRGPDGALWLAWETLDGALAIATGSTLETLVDVEVSGLTLESHHPSLVVSEHAVELWSVIDGEVHHQRAPRSANALAFAPPQLVLPLAMGCHDAGGAEQPCWDAAGVASLEVRHAQSATGREVYRMFYTALGASARNSIGFAASFDGLSWSRAATNPAFTPGDGPQSASAVALHPAADLPAYLLFWGGAQGLADTGVGRAFIAADAPTDTW